MSDTGRETRRSLPVLVADDDPQTAARVRSILSSGGYRNVTALSRFESFEQLEGYRVAILDIVWPPQARPAHEGSSYWGFAALRYLRGSSPRTKVVLMSRHLFDLDHLQRIQEADAYFKSGADASEILTLMAGVLPEAEAEGADVAAAPAGDSFMLMRRPAGASAGAPADSALVAYDYLTLLEQTLLDGRPDLFGLGGSSYDDLVREVRELKQEVRKKDSGATWKERIDLIGSLASGAKNLVDVINAIRVILP